MSNILFLCTGNSARSVFAEVIYNALAEGADQAYSAGSQPTGVVNPLTLKVLQEHGHRIDGLRSKSWNEFSSADAPQMSLVVTVCDNAAGEVCPIWPGHPAKVHLGFPDPAAAQGSEEERLQQFRAVYDQIHAQITNLIKSQKSK